VTFIVLGLAVAVLVVGAIWWIQRRSITEASPSAARGEPSGIGRLGTHVGSIFRRSFDSSFWEELEEQLIAADTGVATAQRLVSDARASGPESVESARKALRDVLIGGFADIDRSVSMTGRPAVVVVVGVNGSGKTTTIAKLASMARENDQSVLVAAADTYRAGAADQVAIWGERLGFDVVAGSDGADPASVAFDALAAARARRVDALVVDTAGRLHSNRNLMDELQKVVRVLEREAGTIEEVLLVIDGSAGQNALAQARAFTEAVGVTGVAVTKLDGTARGGVVLAIEHELGVPLKLVGVGEGPTDMLHFSPHTFVDELLSDA
jgi:fused signal recognition particle receptor